MPQPVIRCNRAQTTLLVDIPASIEEGQQTSHRIKSTSAIENPYPSTEPKGPKKDVLLAAIPPEERIYHETLQREISTALAEIKDCLSGDAGLSYWCHGRQGNFSEEALSTLSLAAGRSVQASTDLTPIAPVILSSTESRNRVSSIACLRDVAVCNPTRRRMVVLEAGNVGEFFIPARASFIMSTLERGLPAFESARHALFPNSRPFNLMLLDPPWSNRSARRSGIYRTSDEQVRDPFTQAVRVVRDYLAPQGLVAVWITNKASVRKDVIEALRPLNLGLHEEWVWIKTTAHGEPVSALNGVWRRPYEILLLFREDQNCQQRPHRRVIAAVPDVHSRKPCLKGLLEESQVLPVQYNALELFARSLTAGWWSWGDEVLKFQHESQWMRQAEQAPMAADGR
ncbi:hypothetical protein ABEF95_010962 [Exophiala dermatitidis]